LDQKRSEQRRDGPKQECPNDAVSQRLSLLRLGQTEHQHGEDHCIVGAEEPLQGDQKGYGDEIRRGDHHEQYGSAAGRPKLAGRKVDTIHINIYTWIDATSAGVTPTLLRRFESGSAQAA
jgi:hypothetical protein